MRVRQFVVCAAALALAGCGHGDESLPGNADDHQKFSVIGEDEVVHATGTEPFWGAEVASNTLTYTTPENQAGTVLHVARFEGRAGISFSGQADGIWYDLLVTEGECSDGMSDRTYPFTATLGIGEELRMGCAWTSERPFTGPENS